MDRTSSERSTAIRIQTMLDREGYTDLWDPDSTEMTCRNPDGSKQSRLDRILVKNIEFLEPTKSIWNITATDHAAILTETHTPTSNPNFYKVITNMRYYNSKASRKKFKKTFDEQLEDASNMKTSDPCKKLEFAKVMIRTLYEDKVRETTKNINIESKLIKEELQLIQERIELKKNTSQENTRLEILTQHLNKITERRGKINAEKLRQKWIDEGEKSSKYFLNLPTKPAEKQRETVYSKRAVHKSRYDQK